MTQPILACMSWRGGARFERCLRSIVASEHRFSRIELSITSEEGSPDHRLALEAQREYPTFEVLCTGRELPTMQHQAHWLRYLEASGAARSDWVFWLAYDDEVRLRGIDAVVDANGQWPLEGGTAYIGPWAMRHEQPDTLWAGDPDDPLESWTSFPAAGPTRLPVGTWIADQLRQPTYMQMSGTVHQLGAFLDLRDLRPRKGGPMRIEMAMASAPGVRAVEEFPEPVSIIYGRSNSDRATYGRATRREDAHLVAWLARHAASDPGSLPTLASGIGAAAVTTIRAALGRAELPAEEWRVRSQVEP